MSKDTITTTINELFNLMSKTKFLEIINQPNIDKYVKKLNVYKFFGALVYAQITDIQGLTQLASTIQDDSNLQEFLRLDTISTSQLSRKQSNLPSSIFEKTYRHLASKILLFSKNPELMHKIQSIYAIDSTTMTLAFSEHQWASFRKTKAGIKLHLGVVVIEEGVLPNKAVLTEAKQSDRSQMEELVIEDQNAIHLFDRGYNDYQQFDLFCNKGIRFVTRLKKNAQYEVIDERESDIANNIYRDALIVLGNDQAGTKMKHPLRMIVTKDLEGNLVTIITNCVNESAKEIGDLYRFRWKIETFFKWMKQHLKIKTFFGKSQNAVYTQIWIALITYCLQMYMMLKIGYKGRLLKFKWKLQIFLFESVSSLMKSLVRQPTKISKGRRTIDHEADYQMIMQQYDDGDTKMYDDLTFDPLFL